MLLPVMNEVVLATLLAWFDHYSVCSQAVELNACAADKQVTGYLILVHTKQSWVYVRLLHGA